MRFLNATVSSTAGLLLGALILALVISTAAFAVKADDQAQVLAIEAGKNGSLWVLGGGKLHQVKDDERQSYALPEAAREMTSLSLAVAADGKLYLAGNNLGVYRSIDVGQSWRKTDKGLPNDSISAVAAHSTLANVVYAHSPDRGIFRSEDGGDSWARVDAGPQEPVLTFLHSNMPGSMETGWLFAGTEGGVARSMDCFCFWSEAGELQGEVTALTYDAEAPMNVYAIAQDILYHSTDGGESWSRMAAPNVVNELAVTGGQLYAGTPEGVFVLMGTGWEEVDD